MRGTGAASGPPRPVNPRIGAADTSGDMPAPRDCRACGAPLPGDVRWCLRCYEPVRELSPRAPQLPPLPSVHEPDPGPRTSRWHAGPTTFGPVGRVGVTIAVALLGPWRAFTGFDSIAGPLMLWYLLGYTILAILVLRHVWRRERVVDQDIPASEGLRSRLARRLPILGRPIPPTAVLGTLGVLALATVAVLWLSLDTQGRYYLVVVGGTAGTGLFLVVWNEL